MKNLISEEIERFLTLSNYDTRLTFSENTNTISEQNTMGATVRELESAFANDLRSLMKQYKIFNKSVGEVTTLLSKDAASFEKEFAKAFAKDIRDGYPKGTVGPMGKTISKIEFLRRVTEEAKIAKSQGRTLTTAEIDTLMNKVAAANKLKAANFKPKPPKPPKPSGGKPTVKPGDANTARSWISKLTPAFFKAMSWSRLLSWGKGLALTGGVLYLIYKLTHGEEPPNVVDNGNTTTPPPPPPTDTTPTPTGYRDCTGTYTYGCKSSAIATVQGCLGLVTDGKFGPKTKAALEEKGFTSFTDADINKICGNSTQTDDNIEDIEDIENVEGEDATNL
jgi:hypothetical protein